MSNEFLAAVPIVLSGPSGVGKTSIRDQLLARYQDLAVSISATTRPIRPGEVHGKDYLFLDSQTFRRGIEDGQFLEWAEVHGELYGTPRGPMEDFLKRGTDVLLVIDVQGGAQVKQLYPEALLIFLLPPSMEALAERIGKRGQDSEDSIRTRMLNAEGEIAFADRYDYWVVNRSLEDAVIQVRAVIVADRLRASRARDRYAGLGYCWPGIAQSKIQ